jgi:hypothetical protein
MPLSGIQAHSGGSVELACGLPLIFLSIFTILNVSRTKSAKTKLKLL